MTSSDSELQRKRCTTDYRTFGLEAAQQRGCECTKQGAGCGGKGKGDFAKDKRAWRPENLRTIRCERERTRNRRQSRREERTYSRNDRWLFDADLFKEESTAD
jgi:50S ribosomal subunit-associated GTPase HflX